MCFVFVIKTGIICVLRDVGSFSSGVNSFLSCFVGQDSFTTLLCRQPSTVDQVMILTSVYFSGPVYTVHSTIINSCGCLRN